MHVFIFLECALLFFFFVGEDKETKHENFGESHAGSRDKHKKVLIAAFPGKYSRSNYTHMRSLKSFH